MLAVGLSGCLIDNPAWLGPPAEATGSGTGTGGSSSSGSETGDEPALGCPPRPASAAAVSVGPEQIGQLAQIVADAEPGSTIELRDGVYDLASIAPLRIEVAGVVLRSASADPSAVVFDGGASAMPLIEVRAPDVVLAEFTVRGGTQGGIMAVASASFDPDRLTVYRMDLIDVGGHAVRGASNGDPDAYADGGEVVCSRFLRQTPLAGQACTELSALRVFRGADWVFRDNEVQGYWCDDDDGEPPRTVSMLEGTRGSVIVRNRFQDCARAVVLGEAPSGVERRWADNPCAVSDQWGHVEGLVANNMLWVGDPGVRPDSMISVWNVCDDRIFHNSIVMLGDGFHGIEHRFERTRATIVNNLTNADIQMRDGSEAIVEGNLIEAGLDEFVDPFAGDLHLVPGSVAIGAALANLGDLELGPDFEGDPRDDAPDVGADEYRP